MWFIIHVLLFVYEGLLYLVTVVVGAAAEADPGRLVEAEEAVHEARPRGFVGQLGVLHRVQVLVQHRHRLVVPGRVVAVMVVSGVLMILLVHFMVILMVSMRLLVILLVFLVRGGHTHDLVLGADDGLGLDRRPEVGGGVVVGGRGRAVGGLVVGGGVGVVVGGQVLGHRLVIMVIMVGRVSMVI